VTAHYEIVIPSSGRPTLRRLLDRLGEISGPKPGRILVIRDDERAMGPAAARNEGLRRARAPWVVFLDDDVVPEHDWYSQLASDLELPDHVAGSQGRIHVPLPSDRRPTDWERNVSALEGARHVTADMAYRRSVLEELGGFDERFPRPFREDADLALRVLDAGYELVQGGRRVDHPVGPSGFWTSVTLQAGNRDDVLMRALHGRRWRERAGAPRGRRPAHLAITAAGVAAVAFALAGRRRAATAASLAWLAGTAELAWRRIARGPRTLDEIARMVATSVALPAAASCHWLVGWAQLPGLLDSDTAPDAVLFDRDGTLVADVPYNGDPDRVLPMPHAREALDRLRKRGVRIAVISNQSGVGRGLITHEQVRAVNRRVEELIGPVDTWLYCPHLPDEGCDCRKPSPGLIARAAERLGVSPSRCAVVGDIGSDVEAARAAGARAVLVPTAETRREEIVAAPEVAADLTEAVALLLGGER
jgi:histidinol-phosphate phosphatase family protein